MIGRPIEGIADSGSKAFAVPFQTAANQQNDPFVPGFMGHSRRVKSIKIAS
jgi:hypothetical protein